MDRPGDRQDDLRELLDRLRQETLTEIAELLRSHRPESVSFDDTRPTDWGDEVSRHIDDEMDAAQLERKGERVRRIEHALDLLDRGAYGHCEKCREAIPIARLRALPFATQCVGCRESNELF
ncbi:MAG: hypothetical protein CME06_03060 [Gemmatimonadetes bacterium]|nr:hypothetical protein [Gemmatimonadota bacterium]